MIFEAPKNIPKFNFFQSLCNTYGLLDLPLVRLDLLLQFVDQILHTFVVLAVLVALEAQLLDPALGFPQVLLRVGVSPLFAVKFVLQLANALFQFGDRLFAALERVVFGLV